MLYTINSPHDTIVPYQLNINNIYQVLIPEFRIYYIKKKMKEGFKMTNFKASVKNRETKECTVVESAYANKTDFIKDLRANGYMVNPDKVKKSEVFDYIIDNTNCQSFDWKENN